MSRWTEQDLQRTNAKIRDQIAMPMTQRRTLHGNRRVLWHGMKFYSEHELQTFKDFELERISGRIRAVVRQISMPLTGSGRRMRLDFMVVENDGRIRWVDAKGHPTKEWLLKRDLVQQAYGLQIETV